MRVALITAVCSERFAEKGDRQLKSMAAAFCLPRITLAWPDVTGHGGVRTGLRQLSFDQARDLAGTRQTLISLFSNANLATMNLFCNAWPGFRTPDME